MQKALVGLVIVVILLVGGYFVFHAMPKTTTPSTSTMGSGTQNQAAINNAVLTTKISSSLGQYLADPNGKALYTFGQDNTNVSNCKAACLVNWPAYQDTGSTSGLPADVSTIKRTDNSETQYTYKGKPLYYFAGDSQGQVTGNGAAGFQVARP